MRIGRFQVMAVLQAARAHILGMPLDMSKSWGINRAIFYAAAKRGFKEKVLPRRREKIISKKLTAEEPNVYFLGDEMAYKIKRGKRTYFTIGGEIQTVEDYERQIETRFGDRYEEVWKEALQIMKQFSKEVLLSQRDFFEMIYKPRRDELARKWTELATG